MLLRSTNKVFLAPLLRMDSNPVLSSDVKKYQQWSPPTMVYTAMCRAVHLQGTSGVATVFFLRLASLDRGAGDHRRGHRHGDGGAPPKISRESAFHAVGYMVMHRP